jgi:hypothetical protein
VHVGSIDADPADPTPLHEVMKKFLFPSVDGEEMFFSDKFQKEHFHMEAVRRPLGATNQFHSDPVFSAEIAALMASNANRLTWKNRFGETYASSRHNLTFADEFLKNGSSAVLKMEDLFDTTWPATLLQLREGVNTLLDGGEATIHVYVISFLSANCM